MKRFITLTSLITILVISVSGTDFARLDYTVSQPMSDDDIHYFANVWYIPVPDDTLAGSNFLIEYSHDRSNDTSFVAYFDRNFFRYDNNRLQEFHWEWDSIPFKESRVQSTGMFTPLIPQNIKSEIARLIADKNNRLHYDRTEQENGKLLRIVKLDVLHGNDIMREVLYKEDTTTGYPVYYESMNNPNSVGEQLVTVSYSYPANNENVTTINEPLIIERHRNAFAKFRKSTFSIENTKGLRIPEFSFSDLNGEQYNSPDGFKNNILLVLLEAGNGVNSEAIESIRQAVDLASEPVGILWVYTTRNAYAVQQDFPGKPQTDERLLLGGRRLATQIGATGFPTMLILDRDAIVRGVQIGLSSSTRDAILQQLERIK